MGIKVRLPRDLQEAGGTAEVEEVAAANLVECLEKLEQRHPKLKGMIIDSSGKIWLGWLVSKNRRLVNIASAEDCRLAEGDEITLIRTVAGG